MRLFNSEETIIDYDNIDTVDFNTDVIYILAFNFRIIVLTRNMCYTKIAKTCYRRHKWYRG